MLRKSRLFGYGPLVECSVPALLLRLLLAFEVVAGGRNVTTSVGISASDFLRRRDAISQDVMDETMCWLIGSVSPYSKTH